MVQLKDIPVGTSVCIQNQTGRHPTKWDKTGVVLENQPFSKVLVRDDGSQRVTTRNRRFLKAILPPIRRVGANQDVQPLNHSPDEDDDDEDYHHLVQQPLLQIPVAQQKGRQDPTATDDRQEPEMEELMIPQSPPHVQGPPVNNPGVGGGLHRNQLPQRPSSTQ